MARNPILKAVAIVAITFAAYAYSFDGAILWDDDEYLYPEKLLTLEGLYRIWFTAQIQQYYPLVHTDFWLEQIMWGMNTAPYHVGNTLLHAIAAVLVWVVSERLKLRGAWLVGALFAVHPLNVESVAWITERKNILSFIFYLLAVISYLDYEDKKLRSRYGLALFLFLLALLSKIVVCTFPVALILIRWLRRGDVGLGYVVRLIPFFGLSLVFGLITMWWEATNVGAEGAEWAMGFGARLVLVGKSAWFYVWKLAYPAEFIFVYPRWELDAGSALQWAQTVAAAAVVIVLFMLRKKTGRAPLAAVGFYLITLSPMLGLMNIYFYRFSFVSDHFPYHASPALLALGAGVAAWGADRVFGGKARAVKIALGCVALAAFTLISFGETAKFQSDETLWRDTLKKNDGAWLAHNNLGRMLFERGEADVAFEHYDKAARIWPLSSEVNYNMGLATGEFGRHEESERYYRRALELKPSFAEAKSGLSITLMRSGKLDEAHSMGLEAALLRPNVAGIQSNMGLVLLAMKRPDDAVVYFERALAIDPAFMDAYNNAAVALASKGDDDGAVAYFKRALSVNPAHAGTHYNLGVTLGDLKRFDEALVHYREAARLDPDHAEAHNNMGNIFFMREDFASAAFHYREAVEIDEDFAQAKKNLETALKRLEKKR